MVSGPTIATLIGNGTLVAGLPAYLAALYNVFTVASNFSVPAYVTSNGAEPSGGKLNKDVHDAVENFDNTHKSPKGTISPNRQAAEQLAKEVAREKGISDQLAGPERHANDLWHVHLEDFWDWHFWFNGDP